MAHSSPTFKIERAMSLSWRLTPGIASFTGRSSKKKAARFYIACSSTPHPSSQGMVVAVTGGTGFIGTRLVQRLAEEGHQIRVLARSVTRAGNIFPAKEYPTVDLVLEGEWDKLVRGSTGVVNLTGTPISTRWTPEVKQEIKRSRVDVTSKVVRAINSTPKDCRPLALVSASAVGYYGVSYSSTYDEASPSGNDYLAQVCREWESAANDVDASVKLVRIRIGIVLDKDGGALAKMVPMFKLFAGGPIGSGKQWFSWVHREDLVSLIIEALKNPSCYQGVINGTAPNPARMEEVSDTIGDVIGRPSWLPVPSFALKALLGEGASAVLDGQRVVPRRAQELGFKFKYPYLRDALKAILTS